MWSWVCFEYVYRIVSGLYMCVHVYTCRCVCVRTCVKTLYVSTPIFICRIAMLRLKKLFHKKRCGRATCHVALPLPPLSTAVETSMAGVLMVVEPWGLETIHECKVSLMWVCVSNSVSLVCVSAKWIIP